MPPGGRVKINHVAWGKTVKKVTKRGTLKAAEQLRFNLRSEIYASGRVQTAQMAEDWNITEIPARTRFGYRVAVWSPHKRTIYQNFGTKGSKPVKAKALRFSPGGGPAIFRMKTGPIAAAKFMERAVGSLRVSDWSP